MRCVQSAIGKALYPSEGCAAVCEVYHWDVSVYFFNRMARDRSRRGNLLVGSLSRLCTVMSHDHPDTDTPADCQSTYVHPYPSLEQVWTGTRIRGYGLSSVGREW